MIRQSSRVVYLQHLPQLTHVSGRGDLWPLDPLAAIPNRILTDIAAKHLTTMSRLEPQLSSDAMIEQVTERAWTAVDGFVRSRVAAA